MKKTRAARRPRLLIIGCGDVAQRALPFLLARFRVFAAVRRPEAAALLRSQGVRCVLADLDNRTSVRRLAGLADAVLYAAPPPGSGTGDPRLKRVLAALLREGRTLQRCVYISTSGVYGDAAGAQVSETWPLRPTTPRAQRRVAAEQTLRRVGLRQPYVRSSILRAPGIYAAERLSLNRLESASPVLQPSEDVFTNHIHADDLAWAAIVALFRAKGGRSFNVSDNAQVKMGDYYDALADAAALPRPPRAARADCQAALSPMAYSFMTESRRLLNQRLQRELRVRLQWPNIVAALPQLLAAKV